MRCAVAVRTTVSLATVVLSAVLSSSCPDGGKGDGGQRSACRKISNTVWVGDECVCKHGYRKVVPSGAGAYDFQCQHDKQCYGGARLQADGTCLCANGSIYDSSNMHAPCGVQSGNRQGFGAPQLQSACQRAMAKWNHAGFCSCDGERQFNALTGQCEPIVWHHTKMMCGTGATFHGQDHGVCVCDDPLSLFHPSFGGCLGPVAEAGMELMCRDLYGVSYNGGRCNCRQGVWFRGSCLDLGDDFVTTIPESSEELRCVLQGMRFIGGKCQASGGVHFGEFQQPIICRRDSLDPRIGKETIIIEGGMVSVETGLGGHSPPIPKREYERIRCEEHALSPGPTHRWERGRGTYKDGNPFGRCYCDRGYTATFDPQLYYSYCVPLGHQTHVHSPCQWATLCDFQVRADSRGLGGSLELCTPGGSRFNFGVSGLSWPWGRSR